MALQSRRGARLAAIAVRSVKYCVTACCVFPPIVRKMSIEKVPPADANDKATTQSRDIKKEDDKSGDEAERKEQESPLEIGEHYLVKRGEDSWRKHHACT